MKYLLTVIFALAISWGYSQENYTHELDGAEMTYAYTGGNSYNLKFENGTISYRYLTGSRPELWWGPFGYKAFKTENGEYFLSWFETGYGDIVTQLLNPKKMTLSGSALIVKGEKKIFHFQTAKISAFDWGK